MSDQTDNLSNLLEPYGLSSDEAKIYLVLLENGVLPALQISRKLKIGRTKVYRLLDKLIAYGLVTNQFDETGFKFGAEPPEKLALLVNLKHAEISALQASLPQLQESLLQRMGSGSTSSKVLYYRGKRGLTQVNFNMTRARGEILSFELSTANAFMEQKEAETLRRELVKNKITTRTITNVTRIEPYTEVKEMVTNFWEIRHIPKIQFEIKAEIFIYNDVYCLYRYTDEDMFAVEIHNPDLAEMQRQVFELLWRQATPMTIIGDQGAAQV